MKKFPLSVISAACLFSFSSEIMAHAGVMGSHAAWDSASATSPTGLSNSGYLEGTSPVLAVTISHSCAHEEPYPRLNHVVVVLPIGKDTVLLDGSKVTATGVLPGSLKNVEELQANGLLAQDATANAWNFTLTGLASGVSTGTSGVTAPKVFANPEFKYQPDPQIGTITKTAVIPFTDSHNKSHTEEANMFAWGGADAPNERYVNLELKPTLPKFPSNKAAAGTAGRCATQAKLYIPAMQICADANPSLGQKKIMTWQMAPTPRFDASNMGETTFLHSPSFIVNRDLVKNPLPTDCTGAATATYDPSTAATVYVYPSTNAVDKAFSYVTDLIHLTPTVAADKVHGCVEPQKWDAAAAHCM